MNDVIMTVSMKPFKDSYTGYAGKRNLIADMEYLPEETADQVASNPQGGTVAEAIAEQTDNTRKIRYSNMKQSLDVSTFLSLAIEYTIRDIIEQRIDSVNLFVKLPTNVEVPQSVADKLRDWYAVDPLIYSIEFRTEGGGTNEAATHDTSEKERTNY